MNGAACFKNVNNGKEATINRALDGSMYPSKKLVHSVFGKINYGGLKHNNLYLGLVKPSGG
jgi:hypothetical protein